MANPVAVPITLTINQQTALSSIVNKHQSSQQLVQRCHIILAAEGGKTNTVIAREVQTTRLTVRLWRNRWLSLSPQLTQYEAKPKKLEQAVCKLFKDAPRAGAPTTFTTFQTAQIISISCEDPDDPKGSNRPITHWSNQEIADEAKKRGIVKSISERTVGRFLKSCQYKTI